MTYLLADATPNPEALTLVGTWLEILFFLIAGVASAVGLVKMLKGDKPLHLTQPLSVKMAEQFVSKEELMRLDGEARGRTSANAERIARVETDLRNQIVEQRTYMHEEMHKLGQAMQSVTTLIQDKDIDQREAIQDVNRQGEDRITKVHDRLNEVVRDIGGLEANSKTTVDAIARMQQTLENVLGRIAPQRQRGGGQ